MVPAMGKIDNAYVCEDCDQDPLHCASPQITSTLYNICSVPVSSWVFTDVMLYYILSVHNHNDKFIQNIFLMHVLDFLCDAAFPVFFPVAILFCFLQLIFHTMLLSIELDTSGSPRAAARATATELGCRCGCAKGIGKH